MAAAMMAAILVVVDAAILHGRRRAIGRYLYSSLHMQTQLIQTCVYSVYTYRETKN